MIVVIEGVDGCGKTSVADAVARALDAEVIAFPNDDEPVTGPLIRAYLRKEWAVGQLGRSLSVDTAAGAVVFQALNIANRMAVMPRLRRADIEGENLVLARYWQSAWCYGQLDGLEAEWLRRTHETMVQADVNILLDAPRVAPRAWAAECLQRRARRDGPKSPERYEGDLQKATRLVELYQELWMQEEADGESDWLRVDAYSRPLGKVIDDVIERLGD